jgi:hypothetical protein
MKQEIHQVLIPKIESIFLKIILYYPEYSRATSKNILKRCKRK